MERPTSSQSHVFHLSRREPLTTVLVLALLAAAAVTAVVTGVSPSGDPHHWRQLWLAAAFLTLLGALWWLSVVVRPMPRAVLLNPDGVRLQWRDHDEYWPWDQVTWRRHGSHGLELVPQSRGCGLPVAFVAVQERGLFWQVVLYFGTERRGVTEAAGLAAGQPVRLTSSQRLEVGIGLLLGGVFLIARDVHLLNNLADSNHGALGELPWARAALYTLGALVLMALLVRELRRSLRGSWSELRFQPEGLEERWPGGVRLWRYDQMDRIAHDASTIGASRLTIHSGDQKLQLGQTFPHYWGAVHLLRQHVPPERWLG